MGVRRHPGRDLADRHGDPSLGDADVLATFLTLVFLPALNVAWFRIKPEHLDEEWCRPKPLRLRPREFQ
jgi:hypothetical protein